MASSHNFSLSKRRSNSSPQLQCEATDFSSIIGTSTDANPATWSGGSNATSPRTRESRSFKADNVTQASVHWLEPKQKAVLCDGPLVPVVKPKARPAVAAAPETGGASGGAQPKTDDLLCCNETIHYLQGSDSDSESSPPGTPRRKPHSCIQRRKTDGGHTFKRISRVASQIFSKLKIQETKPKKPKEGRKETSKSDDGSESESEQPVTRQRSRSLTGRVMKRFGQKDEETVTENSATEPVQAVSPPVAVKAKRKSKHGSKHKSSVKNGSVKRTSHAPVVNFAKFDPAKYPIECTEEIKRAAREKEIEEGIDLDLELELESQTAVLHLPAPGACAQTSETTQNLQISRAAGLDNSLPIESGASSSISQQLEVVTDAPTHTTENIYDLYGSLTPSGTFIPRTVHTQIDYMHCLVPEQWDIMKSSFYWGKIDRYEADNLLENKAEGTFILRDSAQEEFLFSVSFCRYGRTLHARIEQWNHKFSFDAHDPGVYSSDNICGLLEHYKDPNYCMFFEPMLTNPLPRVNPPSLLELSRARICTNVTYDSIYYLKLPNSLKEYLREYHYKQRVRIRRVEVDMPQVPETKQSIVTNTCISR